MASGLLNYTYVLKLLKTSELPLHRVSFHSSPILLPLGLQPVLSPASILHSSFLSSPSSSAPRDCHLHVLKSPLLWSLSFTHTYPPSPNFLNRIQTLNTVWWSSRIWCPQPSSSFLPLSGFNLAGCFLLHSSLGAPSSAHLFLLSPLPVFLAVLPNSSCLILQLCPFFKVLLNSSMKPPLVPPRGDVTTFL